MLKFAAVVVAGVLVFGSAEAQQLNIGVVNSQRLLAEAPQMKAATTKLKQEFDKREADLHDMKDRIEATQTRYQKEDARMTDAERAKAQRDLGDMVKDFQRREREFQEDFNQRRNEEYEAAFSKVKKVLMQIAQDSKFDIILQDSGVAYNSQRVDITDKVLAALNAGAGK